MTVRTYNLFISHSWSYSDGYEKLLALLDARDYFSYKDYSVPKNSPVHNADNDKELEAAIKAQMAPCSVVIILAGVYASYRKWILKEIDLAQSGFEASKPILALEPFGSQLTSRAVKDAADEVVKWNTDSIVSAIRRLG